jgi:hypothetical protein
VAQVKGEVHYKGGSAGGGGGGGRPVRARTAPKPQFQNPQVRNWLKGTAGSTAIRGPQLPKGAKLVGKGSLLPHFGRGISKTSAIVTGGTPAQWLHGVTQYQHPLRVLHKMQSANGMNMGAVYGGPLGANERFIHGTQSTFRDFNYKSRNPGGILGGGIYSNSLPSRPNEYAQMNPSTNRNLNPWMQARFLNKDAALAFARTMQARGHELSAGHVSPNSMNADLALLDSDPMMHHVARVRSIPNKGAVPLDEPVAGPTGEQYNLARTISGHKAQIRTGLRPRDGGQGRIGVQPFAGQGQAVAREGAHFLVQHRAPMAAQMRPLAVREGARLFDLNAPLDPGEAQQAKQLLMQRMGLHRAYAKRALIQTGTGRGGIRNALSHINLSPETQHSFDTLGRLTALHHAGRGAKFEREIPMPDHSTSMVRGTGTPLTQMRGMRAPTGRDLRALIESQLTSHHSGTAYGETPTPEAQHILESSSPILRAMGYHGLIDPEFSHGGGVGKEAVIFDKNMVEPFHNAKVRQVGPYVRQPYPVQMAKQLAKSGANFVQAVRQVRTNGGETHLPLSDEVSLKIVKIGNQVRYYVAPTKHPDAVGTEVNSAQALNLAHRSIVERKGGNLTVGEFNRAMGTSAINPQVAAETSGQAMGPDTMRVMLKNLLPDLDKSLTKVDRRFNPEHATGHAQYGQDAARTMHAIKMAFAHPEGHHSIGNGKYLDIRQHDLGQRTFRVLHDNKTRVTPIDAVGAGLQLLRMGHGTPMKPLTRADIIAKLKERGTELPSRGLGVRENGVVLPREAHPNNLTHTHEGVPLGAYAEPPAWHQVFHPEAVRRLLEGTPGEDFNAKHDYITERYQPLINQRWELARRAVVRDAGWPGFRHAGAVPPNSVMGQAIARANRLGLSGDEARTYIRAYLKHRK